ncbi:MAG: chromosomal replication initiator protein DnaA [Lachnospiraceae bacterium]|nr:chromosomal replication initiator protein DnaA [Lachnospiraceae bacterium]
MSIIEQNWEEIKESIRDENEIMKIAYDIWLKPLQYYKEENNKVFVRVPKKELFDYVQKNYKKLFDDTLSNLMQEKYTVEFTVDEEMDQIVTENHNTGFESNLIKKYRFDNFVVGSNNSLAHSAALHVAENPGKDFNPLFIYGGSGLGKTHLMTSIGHYIMENSKLRVLYVTSEEFTNEVINSIRNGNTAAMAELRDKYRNIDVLLVDDIQFIIGKVQTQEEFFHTFNTLQNNNKAVIITSDKHPSHMKDLEERFRTRFLSGLLVDIQPPVYETRMAILKKFSETNKKYLPDTIIDYIASNIKSNVRELEGAFNKVYAEGMLRNNNNINAISLDQAKEILKDSVSKDKPTIISPQYILEMVADYYHIDTDDITSKKRNADIVLPRQVFMYLCREMTDVTLAHVATILDKKDHSTIIHGCNKIDEEIKINTQLKESIEAIKSRIYSQ